LDLKPNWKEIFLGSAIVAGLYLIPFYPVKYRTLTAAGLSNICNTGSAPAFCLGIGEFIVPIIFYIIVMGGLIFIIHGIFRRN
jgi:hypothetical protein